MQKYYYFKDVLLGLRNTYLKHQKQLSELKQYIDLKDEMIMDYYFWISQGELLFDREINVSYMEEFVSNWNGTIDVSTASKCKNVDGNYVIQPNIYKSPYIVNQNEFNKKVKLILDSNFVKGNIKNNIINNFEIKFFTSTKEISIELIDQKSSLYYSANIDSLYVSSLLVNKKCLENIFCQHISQDNLTSYQIETIENSGVLNKELSILDFSVSSNRGEFLIEEEGNKVYIINRGANK